LTTVLSAGIFFLLLAYWVLGPRISRSLQKLVRLGLFLAALASLAMIFLAGHSGAKSAWEKKIAGTHVGDHPTE
jgi:membrane associated rhomboid family serine protease